MNQEQQAKFFKKYVFSNITQLRGEKMLWCGASWVKRLQFWLNWRVGVRSVAREDLVFFCQIKNTRLLNNYLSQKI